MRLLRVLTRVTGLRRPSPELRALAGLTSRIRDLRVAVTRLEVMVGDIHRALGLPDPPPRNDDDGGRRG